MGSRGVRVARIVVLCSLVFVVAVAVAVVVGVFVLILFYFVLEKLLYSFIFISQFCSPFFRLCCSIVSLRCCRFLQYSAFVISVFTQRFNVCFYIYILYSK